MADKLTKLLKVINTESKTKTVIPDPTYHFLKQKSQWFSLKLGFKVYANGLQDNRSVPAFVIGWRESIMK